MKMNEMQKKECRKLASEIIRRLSGILGEDFEPGLYGVFDSTREAINNCLNCCSYDIIDLQKIANSVKENNELDKVI